MVKTINEKWRFVNNNDSLHRELQNYIFTQQRVRFVTIAIICPDARDGGTFCAIIYIVWRIVCVWLQSSHAFAAQQFVNHAAQQISIPVYAPVHNQKQLISSVKQPYSAVEPVTFTTKVNLICVNATLPSKLYSCANDYV